jgi:hypothetical protein
MGRIRGCNMVVVCAKIKAISVVLRCCGVAGEWIDYRDLRLV